MILSLFWILFAISVLSAQSIEGMLSEAREKVILKDYHGARLVYDAIIEHYPDNVEALLGKARVLSWTKKYDESRTVYTEALRFSPENLEAVTGIADTYAWDKEYVRAIDILKPALKKHPGNREILIRYARYHLWAGKYKDSIKYAEHILEQNPLDNDAITIKEQSDDFITVEYYAGYSYLDINNAVDGKNMYAGIRYYEKGNFEVYGQVDHLDRFNQTDVRGLIGGSAVLHPKLTLSAEIAGTPDAMIYPNFGGWLEAASPVTPAVVLYCNLKYSDYDDVNVRGIAFAAEFYPGWHLSLFGRVTLTESEFATGGDSDDTSYMIKATYFINNSDEMYGYYASGNESFKIETIDSVGNIEAEIYGAGGTFFLNKHFGLSPELEYQDRARGTKYINFRLELIYRR
jgi:YaiO family outer membrane protein